MASTTALIGLGSNVGDRRGHLDRALASLAAIPGIELLAASDLRATDPVGGPSGQGRFLNAAARLAVDPAIDPRSLLAILHRIEADAGRVRVARWGERTLDLDLLLFGDRILDSPDLTLPHPRFAVRRFVLGPLAEVAPEVVDPLSSRTVAGLLANLDRRPSLLALDGRSDLLTPILRSSLPDDWIVLPDAPSLAPTFVASLPGGRSHSSSSTGSHAGRVVLRLEGDDLQSIAREILAACEASRSG